MPGSVSGEVAQGKKQEQHQEQHQEEEEIDDDEVRDNPLPIWLDGDSLAPPCQADMSVVEAIIDFAEVTEDDVLYDLGCGDGRICIAAAESRGAKACGVEIEEDLAEKFRRWVAAKGLESKVSVIHGDLRDISLSDATVVVMYLLPEAMAEIAESHLLPLLRRGQHASPAFASTIVGGEDDCRSNNYSKPEEEEVFVEERAGSSTSTDTGISETNRRSAAKEEALTKGGGRQEDHGGGGVVPDGRQPRPCRIVCNTWGIPGVQAVREAGVGMYGGVKLRLFTHESLQEGLA